MLDFGDIFPKMLPRLVAAAIGCVEALVGASGPIKIFIRCSIVVLLTEYISSCLTSVKSICFTEFLTVGVAAASVDPRSLRIWS